MKNTNKKLNGQSKVVRHSFTGSSITKYSGLNTVAKYMNKQGIIKSVRTLSPTRWHSAIKFGVNPVKLKLNSLSRESGNNIFTKPTARSLPDYVNKAGLTGSSRRHKNKESLPAAGREENMNTNPGVNERGTFHFLKKINLDI